MGIEVRITLDDTLSEHVHTVTDGNGWYAGAEEYIHELIRQDLERRQVEFEAIKAELQHAFAAPKNTYVTLTAQDVIDRNLKRR